MRSEVVRCGLLMVERGLVAGTQGNVSARSTSGFVVTPSGVPYDSVTDEDLIEMALHGEVLDGRLEPSSEWRVHAAIYRARPDVNAIVHTHSSAATAWTERNRPLDHALVAAFAPTGTDDLAGNAVEALKDHDAVLLAHHGVVGVGTTLGEAFAVCERLEERASRATP